MQKGHTRKQYVLSAPKGNSSMADVLFEYYKGDNFTMLINVVFPTPFPPIIKFKPSINS